MAEERSVEPGTFAQEQEAAQVAASLAKQRAALAAQLSQVTGAEVHRAARAANANLSRSIYLQARRGRWEQLIQGALSAVRIRPRLRLYEYNQRPEMQALQRDWQALSRDILQAVERAERVRNEQAHKRQDQLFDPEASATEA